MFDPVDLLVRFLAPDAGPDVYNDWRFVLTSALSDETRLGIAVLLGGAVVASAFGLRRLGMRRRGILLVLRAVAAAIVLLIVLMPAIELRAVSRVRSRVALLVDRSRSMGLATPDGTRAELVERHLDDNAAVLARLAKTAQVEPATFADQVQPVERLPSPLPTTGARTDLAGALAELSSPTAGRDLGAVIVYSDGTDTEGLTAERARAIGEELGVPIYAVGFSADSAAADLAIRRIIADDFAFVHNTVTLDVELEERGLSLSSALVTLKHGTEVVASKDATFAGDGRARVSFDFKPTQIGKLAYQVSVPVQEGEVVASNNSRSIVLKVIRDRIRVLQVAGRPSWDERFLRELLKRNPNVDLISFFILRTPTDLQRAAQEELALIPFPVNELFTHELSSFDVVIYQNFTYRPYRMARYLRNIADYVRAGGGFLMVGGDKSFEDGWYAGTAIASVLPVRLGGSLPWETSEYRPRLTRQGRRHPITRIGEPGEPPESVYARLPALTGVNSALGLMPNAQVLLSHPSLPGNPPVVSIREVDRGRTMAVATDTLWFWRFVAVGDGGAGREFDRFWNNALRWLIRDPELARVRIRSSRSVYPRGEAAQLDVRVLGADYRGLMDAMVRATVTRFDGRDEKQLKQITMKTGTEGTAVVDLGLLEPGTYVLEAEAFDDNERIGVAREPLIVEAADIELQAPFPRPEILEALAAGSEGRFIDIGDRLGDVEVNDPRRVEIDRTRQVAIWDSMPAFVLLLFVVAAEWWLRRRSGLI